MGAYDCWCAQKPKLRESLKDCTDAGHMVYAIRHALAQVEQNTLAEKTDDLLRQQMGILFSCCKMSVNLLDMSVATKVWQLQSQKEKKKSGFVWGFWSIAGLAQVATGLIAYIGGQPFAVLFSILALVTAMVALLKTARQKKKLPLPEEQFRVTLRPDEEKLFTSLDAQMQAIDQYTNDFAYLNEQVAGKQTAPERKLVAAAADILEALYEADEKERQGIEEAVSEMLEGMGLAAIPYSKSEQQLFTTLPSKDETRTLIPALVWKEDDRLVKRGVAAVRSADSDA